MSEDMRRAVVEKLATWLDIDTTMVEAVVDAEISYPALIGALRCAPPARLERMARRLAMLVLRNLGNSERRVFTTALKKLRRATGYRVRYDVPLSWVDLFHGLRAALNADGFRWEGKRAVVCLTHDLDSWEDLEMLDPVIELEREQGVRSTINFLTRWEYRLDRSQILSLRREGFEIGLHGDEHDIALGYRNPREIRRKLERALSDLPCEVRGFRAPALSGSEALLTILDELGFSYDSSLPTFAPFGRGVGTCFPYRFPGLEIWEIPLTLQDSTLFRDQGLTEATALAVTRDLLQRVVGVHGVFVLNTHPSIIRRVPRYYGGVLDDVQKFASEVMVARMSDVVAAVRSVSRRLHRAAVQ